MNTESTDSGTHTKNREWFSSLKKSLGFAWTVFANALAALSLASMTDQAVVWASFFAELIEYYRRVRDFFLADLIAWVLAHWTFLIGYLPDWISEYLRIPQGFIDYVTLGCLLMVGPFIRALFSGYPKILESAAEQNGLPGKTWPLMKELWGQGIAEFKREFCESEVKTWREFLLRCITGLLGTIVVIGGLLLIYPFAIFLLLALWPMYLPFGLVFLYLSDSGKDGVRIPRSVFWRALFECLLAPAIFLLLLVSNTFIARFVGIHVAMNDEQLIALIRQETVSQSALHRLRISAPTVPSDYILMGAANPCPSGNRSDPRTSDSRAS